MSATFFQAYQAAYGSAKAGTQTVIAGLRDHRTTPGATHITLPAAGIHWPRVRTLAQLDSQQGLDTLQLETLFGMGEAGDLDQIIREGLKLDSSPASPDDRSFNLYWKRKLNADTYAADGHRKCTVNAGRLMLVQLAATQGAAAMASLLADPICDGTNNGVVFESTDTVPALDSEDEVFSMGPVYIESTLFEGVTGWTFSTGIGLAKVFADGQLQPRLAWLGDGGPMFDVNLATPDVLDSYGFGGGKIDATAVFYLVKCDAVGNRLAYDENEHIAITVNHGTITPREATGRQVGAGMMVGPVYDGTNKIVTVTTDVQLPAALL